MTHSCSIRAVVAAIAICGTLASCAGTNFVRVPEEAFVLGKSTTAEVSARMGAPYRTSTLTKNEKQIAESMYAYAEASGDARGQHFYFFDNVLVGIEFLSSFANDSTDYDDSKTTQIQKGKSTRADVIALMGKPDGEFIYPLIATPGDTSVVYDYARVTGAPFATKFYIKSLVVSFGPDGVADNVESVVQGTRPP